MTSPSAFATTLMEVARASTGRPAGSGPIVSVHHAGDHLELHGPHAAPVRLPCSTDRDMVRADIHRLLGWMDTGTDLLALGDAPPWTHDLGWEVYLYDIGHYWWLVEDLREEKDDAVQVLAFHQADGQLHVRFRSTGGVTTESRPLTGHGFTGAAALEMALDHLGSLRAQRTLPAGPIGESDGSTVM